MNNTVTSAGTEVEISTKAELLPSAPLAANPMLAAVLTPRKYPCLCCCCPTCGAVFMATALKEEYHNDFDNMKELLDDVANYARQGYSIVSKDASEFRLDYCEHLKENKV